MTLTIEDIQAAVRQADRHLEANGVGGEQRARFRLLLEDVLISYRERAEGAPFRLTRPSAVSVSGDGRRFP